MIFILVSIGVIYVVVLVQKNEPPPKKKIRKVRRKVKSKPPLSTKDLGTNTSVPVPVLLRRAQQALLRTQDQLSDQSRELKYANLELQIRDLLVTLGEKHIAVKDDLLEKDRKDNELRSKELDLKEMALKIIVDNEMNRIKEGELQLQKLENDIMLALGLEDLKIREIDLKEQGLGQMRREIQVFYEGKMVQVDRESVKLMLEKADVDRRWEVMNYLEDVWYHNGGLPATNSILEHFYKGGFTPGSPLVRENRELRSELEVLRQRLGRKFW